MLSFLWHNTSLFTKFMMNCQDWERLVLNWDLLRCVHPDDVIPHLFQAGVLDWEPSEKNFENIYDLLYILQKKKNKDTLQHLLEALKENGHETVAEAIESTKVSADPKVKPRGDPSSLEPRAREVLLKKFVEKKDAEVDLSEIYEELKESGLFHEITWSNEQIKTFLYQLFNGIEIKPPLRRRKGNKKVRMVVVKNLHKCNDDEVAEGNSLCSSEEQANREIDQTKGVKDWSPAELLLKQFLLPQFMARKFPLKPLETLEEQCVSGDVFLTLKEEDFMRLLPKASFRIHRFLSLRINELSQQPIVQGPSVENLREFDNPVSHVTMYTKGLCCDISNFAKDKTTRPVKMFHVVPESCNSEVTEFIASEVVPFAAACLNKRRNGTIYFGISNNATNLHESGEIVGVSLDQNKLAFSSEEGGIRGKRKSKPVTQQTIHHELALYLEQSFLPCHQEIIKHTVRDAKFIPVVTRSHHHTDPRESLWVIEIDVKPQSMLVQNQMFPALLKLLPVHGRKKNLKDGMFIFSADGKPKLLDSEARHNFEKEHQMILAQRKQDELNIQVQLRPNLRTKLLNLLTGGNEMIEDMMYFILVLSPVTESLLKYGLEHRSLNAENFQFVKYLGPEIVFDFDPNGSDRGLYNMLQSSETMRVLTTDNFDESKRTQEEIKQQGDSMDIENKTVWFFCNGYSPTDIMQFSAVEWNKKRRSCFQECLRLFISKFGKERVTVLICLLSKDYDIMTDASGEILAKLSDNWIVLAESEEVAKSWQNQVVSRNWVDEQDLNDRCIIGMPWDHVNSTILQAKRPSPSHICFLPTSTGALIEVKEKKIKDLCHIDVLSANFKPHDDSISYSQKAEEKFYRGEQAKWSNFFFNTQVLVRDKHKVLKDHVEKVLKNPGKGKRNKVATVDLAHQPMAGGTTSAKQILWDLREQYRCCVVKAIINERTAQELNELHKYDEINPKPLLVLIDNEDDDKLAHLLEELEDQGQKMKSSDVDDTYEVYCVAIICRRTTSTVRPHLKKGVFLQHELSKNELQWFVEKGKYLNQRFERDGTSYMDPKFLIAFNIMKERFNPKYIETTLCMFIDAVVEEWEVKLLKMVCFLNFYDPSFTKISVSCLDDLLLNKKGSWGTKKKMLVRNKKWEACLSPAVKVLLNLSSESLRSEKNRSTVCTFNKLVAGGVLKRIMERTKQKLSEVMLELLDSGMFVEHKQDSASLMGIVGNIIKARIVSGKIKQKFSQFIIDLKAQEGSEKTVYILDQVFEMNNDPFTAQLIARFYMIEMKNWDDAEHYARRATSKMPTNTYLWDTYAQVYQSQLQDECSDASKSVTRKVIQHWISLSIKSLDMFRKEEEINDEQSEKYEPLLSCYFGELKAAELILQAVSEHVSFSSPSSLHCFLVEPQFVPEELTFLTEEEVKHLKSLRAVCEEAFTRLNDASVQMKKNYDFTSDEKGSDYDFESLGKFSSSLETFFGQEHCVLNSPEREFYNFSLAKKLGGTHLNEMLSLREKSVVKLRKIYELMQHNVRSESARRFEYLLTLVGSCTILICQNSCPADLQFNTLLSWCHSLIESDRKRPRG